MHETLAAHLFKALKLGKRIKVVVDAQIEIRPILVTANHERCRLLSALVAASGLARLHGDNEPARERKPGIRLIGCRSGVEHVLSHQHVAGERKAGMLEPPP